MSSDYELIQAGNTIETSDGEFVIQVDKFIAQGGQGSIYSGLLDVDGTTHKIVIKTPVSQDMVDTLRKEGETMANLLRDFGEAAYGESFPSITFSSEKTGKVFTGGNVEVISNGQKMNVLIMEFLDGETGNNFAYENIEQYLQGEKAAAYTNEMMLARKTANTDQKRHNRMIITKNSAEKSIDVKTIDVGICVTEADMDKVRAGYEQSLLELEKLQDEQRTLETKKPLNDDEARQLRKDNIMLINRIHAVENGLVRWSGKGGSTETIAPQYLYLIQNGSRPVGFDEYIVPSARTSNLTIMFQNLFGFHAYKMNSPVNPEFKWFQTKATGGLNSDQLGPVTGRKTHTICIEQRVEGFLLAPLEDFLKDAEPQIASGENFLLNNSNNVDTKKRMFLYTAFKTVMDTFVLDCLDQLSDDRLEEIKELGKKGTFINREALQEIGVPEETINELRAMEKHTADFMTRNNGNVFTFLNLVKDILDDKINLQTEPLVLVQEEEELKNTTGMNLPASNFILSLLAEADGIIDYTAIDDLVRKIPNIKDIGTKFLDEIVSSMEKIENLTEKEGEMLVLLKQKRSDLDND